MDGRRKALIIANDEYDHEGLRHLRSPAADAEALAGVLGDQRVCGFEVETVHNEPSYAIQTRVEDLLADGRPDDVLLLHFSCHGLKSESGELFFAARNTRPNRLSSTAIPADFVRRCMQASRSRSVVLLLDCCYGGAFSKGVAVRSSGDVNVLDSFPGTRVGGGRGRAVITASNSIEYAFEGDDLADDNSRPSVFTTALVEGLATGDADRDEDGWVSLNELYDYVFDRVRAQTPHQTPSRDVEMQGELYLARSRRRRIKPQPIPSDLQAAMTDSNMFTRLGAVTELRARLLSDNLPAAVGAHEALAEIARTDIQPVADPARAALAATVLRVEETELRFDGTEPRRRTVTLLGPPVARICTAEPSADWIQVEESSGGFIVTADQAGAATATLTLKGPTGEVHLPIITSTEPRSTRGASEEFRAEQDPPPAPGTRPEPSLVQPAQSYGPAPIVPPTTPEPQPEVRRAVYGASTAPGLPPAPRTAPRRTAAAQIGTVLWALIPFLSLSLLAFVPSIHAAIRLRKPVYWLSAAAYLAVLAAFLVAPQGSDAASALLLVMWIGSTVHAFFLRVRVFAPLPPRPPERSPAPEVGTRAAVPHFRVVALGVAGSGKTVYLSSMFHTVNVPTATRSYFLETAAAQRIYLSQVFDEVSDTAEPWPRGTRTGETRELAFECMSLSQGVKHHVFTVSYLDYAGELLESAQASSSIALNDLEARIQSAHGLLGMLDGYRVLQFLRGEQAGLRYLRSSLQPMTGMMAGATCPIHFILTKWDLVRGFGEPEEADDNVRLGLVRDALMNSDQLKAIVDTHSWAGRIVRLIPVSAVGPAFAQMAADGRILKVPNGEVRPTNVEVPLTAILPDLFQQVELSLDPTTRQQLAADARSWRGARFSLPAFLTGPAGSALGRQLRSVVGGAAGREVIGMFLDWMGGTPAAQARTSGAKRREAREHVVQVEEARARVMREFVAEVQLLEERLPASRLSSR